MKLYSYPKSTTSYRVRAALNLKGLPYEIAQVDLLKDAQPDDDLDAIHPDVPMLPADPLARSRIMSVALVVTTDIYPVNTLRVIDHIKDRFNAPPAQTYNASRWGVDLTRFPKISRIERACLAGHEIASAHPDTRATSKDDR